LEQCEPLWPKPGERFGEFVLLRELGRGAFARVFLATESGLGNRRVVVKLSKSGGGEAETLGRLEHSSIIPIYSARFDRASRLTAVCMPYLGTATLRDVVAHAFEGGRRPTEARIILEAIRAKLPAEEPPAHAGVPADVLRRGSYLNGVLHLATQMAEALAFLHTNGVCHCDLKLSNILITPSGHPLLLDFNLAGDSGKLKLLRGGTPRTMAPEQQDAMARNDGNWDVVDAQSDLYSFGVVLYELLTGTAPFELVGTMPQGNELYREMLRLQRAGAPPIRTRNPEVAASVARIVEQCLAFEPKDRPLSAHELAIALKRCQAPWPRICRWLTRHSRRLLFAACLVSIIVIPLALILATRPPASLRALELGLAAERDGRHEEAIAQLDLALAAHPHHGEARFARGRARYRLAETLPRKERDSWLRLAEDDLENSSALLGDPRIWACLGYCANSRRVHTEAIMRYQHAIQAGFASAAVWNNLGYSYLQAPRSDWDNAVECFDNAIEQDGHFQVAYYNRALGYYQLALRDDNPLSMNAISDIEEAMRLGPVSAEMLYHAACLCARLTRVDSRWFEAGLDFVRRAIERGYDPMLLRADAGLAEFQGMPQFQAVLRLPSSPASTPTVVRLVDPFQ
jgi:serine/threonine protein kinase